VCLAREARRLGAVAASAFGAGFGGSVWALVAEADSEAFTRAWRAAFGHAHPEAAARAVFFETAPGPAAFRLA
jgi:galactokinase